MHKSITGPQVRVLRALATECQNQAPVLPSVRDVAQQAGLSPGMVHKRLKQLFDAGLVGHSPGIARTWRPTMKGLELLAIWNYNQNKTSKITSIQTFPDVL